MRRGHIAFYSHKQLRATQCKSGNRSTAERELATVKRDHAKLVDAIIAGVPAEQLKDKMIALDARRKDLEAQLATAETSPAPLRFHPGMAQTYRERVAQLILGLGDGDAMEEAKEALRGLIEKIGNRPG